MRQVVPSDHFHETMSKLTNGVMTGSSAIASASNGVN